MNEFENMMRDNMLKTRMFKIPEDITDPKHRVFWWNERRCIVSAKEAAQFLEDKIKELETKLKVAVEALKMISCDNIYVGENGWRDEYLLNYKQATEALAAINEEGV